VPCNALKQPVAPRVTQLYFCASFGQVTRLCVEPCVKLSVRLLTLPHRVVTITESAGPIDAPDDAAELLHECRALEQHCFAPMLIPNIALQTLVAVLSTIP